MKITRRHTMLPLVALFTLSLVQMGWSEISDGVRHLVAEGGDVHKAATGYSFTEGGARDAAGNIYFTDIPNQRIHKWDAATGEITLVLEESGRANGTWVDGKGNLIICQGGARQVSSLAPDGSLTVLVDSAGGKRLNSPNDLWMDAKGGLYITDPRYGKKRDDMEYEGEWVFYLSADRKSIVPVEKDMVRPNGIIGTGDGNTLYIADSGGRKTYVYDIIEDGTLSNKRLFADEGSDGMALDNQGNVYLTSDAVKIYSSTGDLLGSISVEKRPTNVAFGGNDAKTLFITARDSIYTVPMKVSGVGSN